MPAQNSGKELTTACSGDPGILRIALVPFQSYSQQTNFELTYLPSERRQFFVHFHAMGVTWRPDENSDTSLGHCCGCMKSNAQFQESLDGIHACKLHPL